jgi:histone H3/H4
MMQQAAHDATLYCAEAKRKVIMPRDNELALKRLVLPEVRRIHYDSLIHY